MALAYAAHAADHFAPFSFERRAPEAHDVKIDILFCGICHSDVHFARGEWGDPHYPCVPGHEIVGRVSAIGSAVQGYKPGDLVGVGCLVDSCRVCPSCQDGLEQYCENGATGTYGGVEKQTGWPTYGGYSDSIVVREEFVLRITHPERDLAAVAPLLCAGITTWSPLRHWKAGPGKKVGVVGIGGLGHMAVKLARAMNAHVVAFTTSPSKRDEAIKLGANEVVISRNDAEMAKHHNSFDLILNTVSATQNLDHYTTLLKLDGTLVLLGAPPEPHSGPNVMSLLMKRRSIAGSIIGGLPETQEMLDFCAEHGIVSDIEMTAARNIENAYDRIVAGDVKYRFVMDMATLPGD